MESLKDLASRAAWTAAETAATVVVAAGSGWLNVSVWEAAGVAAGAAALSAIKTYLVNRRATA